MKIIRILALITGGLVAGAMFGIWRGYNPTALSATASVEQHQQAVRGLNVILPGLGAVTIVLTMAIAVHVRQKRLALLTFAFAALLFGISGIVTRTRNQPINRVVMHWDARTPPTEWLEMRKTWWQWHLIRTFTGIAGFVLLAGGVVFWPDHRVSPNKTS
jgi:Domain of unknown function (DUF1772).